MKRIIVEGGEPFLPEWDDWGKLFSDGLKLLIPGFFFGLPGVLLILLSIGGSFLSIVSLGNSEFIHNFLEPLESLLPLFPIFGMVFFLLCFGSGMILAFVLGFLQAPAICHVVASDQISGAFRIMEWVKILKQNFIGFLLANLILYLISMVISLITQVLSMTIILIVLLPILGAFVGVYSACIYYVLLARAYVTGRSSVSPID